MSERARTVGGNLRITSRGGQGTRVLVTMPLVRKATAVQASSGAGVENT
jgi:nitrate/nitrite-specific signal transduction histidine kinase